MKAKYMNKTKNGEKEMEQNIEKEVVKTPEIFYKLKIPVIASGDIDIDQRRLVGVILKFVEKQMSTALPTGAWKINSFHAENADQIVDCIVIPGRRLWALRYSHAEHSFWNFAMIEHRGKLEFGIEIAHCIDEEMGIQEILRSLSGVMDLKSEIPFGGESPHVSSEEQCNWLWKCLTSPDRKFPVIIISELYRASMSSPYESRFLLKPSLLAARLFGNAGVVALDYQGTQIWRELFGREFAVFDGAIRVIYPFKSQSGKIEVSTIAFKDTIRQFDAGEKAGYSSFLSFLETGIRNYIARQFVNWDGLFFYNSAMILLEESAKLSGRKRGRPPKLKTDETLLEQRLQASQKELSKLRRQLHIENSPPEPIRKPEKRTSPHPRIEKAVEKNPYEDILKWANSELAGKIYLHSRAQRGLLKAQYRSPELVRQALALLANEYRDCRMKKIEDKMFKMKCRELGLAYRRSITLVRATVESDTYFIDYPPEKPRRRFLKYKLSKGTSHQPRYCLRIYFFWDLEKQVVIIGSLPHHLSNRTT